MAKHKYLKNSNYENIKSKSRYLNHGGNLTDIPSGGFPPIYLCDNVSVKNDIDNKNREYSTHKTSVSIKDILNKRRDIKPIIVI